MLVCKHCGGSRVMGIIPNAIRLEVQVDRVGDITEKLLKDAGLWKENRHTNQMVVSEQIRYDDINFENVDQLVCKDCGRVGNIDLFDNINQCRCGNRTDVVVLCRKHLFIICPRCFEPYMCDECRIMECTLNPKNKDSGGYAKVFEGYQTELDDWEEGVDELPENPPDEDRPFVPTSIGIEPDLPRQEEVVVSTFGLSDTAATPIPYTMSPAEFTARRSAERERERERLERD